MIGVLVMLAIFAAFALGWVACHLAYQHELRRREEEAIENVIARFEGRF